MIPSFTIQPAPTTFIVNVIHVHAGKQDEAFQLTQHVVHYVAERKPGFLWSNLAKSTDGLTVSEFHNYTAGDLVLPKALSCGPRWSGGCQWRAYALWRLPASSPS
jgi:hypothetical protein